MQNRTEIIFERILKLLGMSNDAEFCAKYGVKKNTFSTWKKRDALPHDFIIDLIQNANLSLDYVFFGKEIVRKSASSRQIALLPYSAGCGSVGIMDAWVHPVKFVELDDSIIPSSSKCKYPALIKIYGDSMSPIYEEGDYVLLDMVNGRSFEKIDGTYMVRYGDSIQIKHVTFLGNGDIYCSSENAIRYPAFSPLKDYGLEWEILAKPCGVIKIGVGLLEKQ